MQEGLADLNLDPIVQVALKNLTESVNLSMLHPLDRDRVIRSFRVFRHAGIPFDPDEVRAWLVRTGVWSPEYGDYVRKVAADIQAGKRLRGGRISKRNAGDVLNRWKEQAERMAEQGGG